MRSSGEDMAKFLPDGAVELMHNGSKRFETTSAGAKVTGDLDITGVLTYEDVTNVDSVGVITARSGVLVGSGITLSPDGDVFSVGFSTIGNGSSGGFELYHQGVKRVSSQSYGAFIHGALVSSNDIKVGSYVGRLIAGTSNEFTIQHDNANTLVNNTVGILSITSSNNVAITTNFSVSGVSTLGNGSSGQVFLQYQGSTKLSTQTWGTRTTGTVQALNGNLQAYKSSSDTTPFLKLTNNTCLLYTSPSPRD